MAKSRMNIQLEDSTKKYCVEQSEVLGISINGFINVCIAQYRQQQEALKMASDFKPLIDQIEQLQIEIKKQQHG